VAALRQSAEKGQVLEVCDECWGQHLRSCILNGNRTYDMVQVGPAEARIALEEFYKEVDPSKVANVDALLMAHPIERLKGALVLKYNRHPFDKKGNERLFDFDDIKVRPAMPLQYLQ
jgi:hypothetical protein